MTKLDIKAYIDQIQEDIQKLAALSKLGVLNQLKKVINCTNEKKTQQRDKLKALEVVNKMLGFNAADKQIVTQRLDINGLEDLTQLTENELRQRIASRKGGTEKEGD